MRKLIVCLIVLALFTATALVQGAPPNRNNTWDGGGDGFSWSDAANWAPNYVPRDIDTIVINAPGSTIVGYEMNISDQFLTLDLQAGTLQSNLYFGYNPSGGFTVSGGTLEAASWFQVGRDYDATLTQDGGTVLGGYDLFLGEGAFTGYGTYNMNGGLLEITGSIEATNGEFNFAGGTINLLGGDYRSVIGEAWWNGAASASYDGQDTTIVVPEPATLVLLGLGGLLFRRRR